MNQNAVVFYHANCADGFGAATAAWMRLGEEAEYVAVKYGDIKSIDDVDLLGAINGKRVYILDFSFPRDVMEYIINATGDFIWLDHHKTAFEMWTPDILFTNDAKYSRWDDEVYITLDNSKCGAMLAWEYFHGAPSTTEAAPLLFKMLDDYDRWRFKLEGTKELNKSLWASAPWTFEQWAEMVNFPVILTKRINEGAALLRDHNNRVEQAVKNGGRYCTIAGEHGLFVNAPANVSSDVGHKLAVLSGTYGMTYSIGDDFVVRCSIRSTGDYDVSALAKSLGGGGHKNAAGFEMGLGDFFNRMLVTSTKAV